jgi:hypothetical protein
MIDPFFDKDAPNCKECGVQMERGFDSGEFMDFPSMFDYDKVKSNG